MSKTWKAVERRVAALFGSTRNPLSGRNGKQTASDSLHPRLFVETKHRKKQSLWTLFDGTRKLAKKECKIPVLAIAEHNRPGVLVCVHQDDLDKLVVERLLQKPELFYEAQAMAMEESGDCVYLSDLDGKDVRDTIRLGCSHCVTDSGDGITLEEAREAGWKSISREQTLAQAEREVEELGGHPLDWWTHLGTCPDCWKGGDVT